MTVPANVTRFLFEVIGLGEQLRVLAFEIREHLSEPFQVRIHVACENPDLDFEDLACKPAVLTLFDEKSPRLLHGEVFLIQQGESGKKFTHYQLELIPKFEFLKYRSGARIFQGKSVPDIISQVLSEANIKPPHFKLKLTKVYGPRSYCVQYQETEFHFLSRLMEEEGMIYYFEHHLDKHVMVITDSTTTCLPIQGDKKVGFHPKTGLVSDKFAIHQFSYAVSNVPGKVTLNDFDFEKPKLNLEKTKSQGKMASLESYEYPGQYRAPGQGAHYATVKLQGQQALAITVKGQTDNHNLVSGCRFELKDYPREDYNQEYLLVCVSQQGKQPQSLDEGASSGGTTYALNFEGIPSQTAYRASQQHKKRKVQGTQSAIVCGPPGEEIYVDKFGRVKLQFHWDREGQYNEQSSCWVRVSQSWAGKQWGAVVLPRVGQEVLVQFLNGDPDQPIVTGRVYHGKNPPPYELPANKTRTTFKTLSTPKGKGYHELRIEDKKGSEQIYVHAEKDLEVRVKNDHKEWIGNDSHHLVNKSRQAKIGKDEHVYIEGNLNQKIGQSLSRTIGKDSHTDIKKNLKAQAQTLHLKAGVKVVVQSGVELTLKGGAGFIKMDPSGVTIQGPMVKINTGCNASSAQGASPTSPLKPLEPEKLFTGFLNVPGIPTPPPEPVKIPFKSGAGTKITLEPEPANVSAPKPNVRQLEASGKLSNKLNAQQIPEESLDTSVSDGRKKSPDFGQRWQDNTNALSDFAQAGLSESLALQSADDEKVKSVGEGVLVETANGKYTLQAHPVVAFAGISQAEASKMSPDELRAAVLEGANEKAGFISNEMLPRMQTAYAEGLETGKLSLDTGDAKLDSAAVALMTMTTSVVENKGDLSLESKEALSESVFGTATAIGYLQLEGQDNVDALHAVGMLGDEQYATASDQIKNSQGGIAAVGVYNLVTPLGVEAAFYTPEAEATNKNKSNKIPSRSKRMTRLDNPSDAGLASISDDLKGSVSRAEKEAQQKNHTKKQQSRDLSDPAVRKALFEEHDIRVGTYKELKKEKREGYQREHFLPHSNFTTRPKQSGETRDNVPVGQDYGDYNEGDAITYFVYDDQSKGTEHRYLTDVEKSYAKTLHEKGEHATVNQWLDHMEQETARSLSMDTIERSPGVYAAKVPPEDAADVAKAIRIEYEEQLDRMGVNKDAPMSNLVAGGDVPDKGDSVVDDF